jgi:acyl carrier protein
MTEVEDAYREVRGSTRSLRQDDRLEEDLDIDSLLAMELLVELEDRCEVELIGDPRTTDVRTVGDLAALIAEVRAGEEVS